MRNCPFKRKKNPLFYINFLKASGREARVDKCFYVQGETIRNVHANV